MCIKNEELCIKNEELCIENEELCIKNDEFRQAAQEYTGQQIHAVNLVTMWEEYLAFDTKQ